MSAAAKEREGRRERKREKTDLFKSGRKNPLGISDLLRGQLDVSNERGQRTYDDGLGKTMYALIDSRTCGRPLRDALRCPYTWTRLPPDIDIPCCPVRFR